MRKSCGKQNKKTKMWTIGDKRKLEAQSRMYNMEKELEKRKSENLFGRKLLAMIQGTFYRHQRHEFFKFKGLNK